MVMSATGIISNLALCLAKVFIGIFCGSITIIIDGVHNLYDVANSVFSLFGFKLSHKPADKEHPFGHARYDYIFGLIMSVLMITLGLVFAKECIEKIILPTPIEFNILVYIVLALSLLIKILLLIMYLKYSKKLSSDIIKANINDARNDIISSLAIIISIIVMHVYNINIDGYVGLAVAILIIYSSSKIMFDIINTLICEKPDTTLVKTILSELSRFELIDGFHNLQIHCYGYSSIYVTVHAEMPSKTTLIECYDLINKIERHFAENLNIELVIKIDPVDKDNERTKEIYDLVKSSLKRLNGSLKINGLRAVYNGDEITVLFEIVEDYDCCLSKSDINQTLQHAFASEQEQFNFDFSISKPFV